MGDYLSNKKHARDKRNKNLSYKKKPANGKFTEQKKKILPSVPPQILPKDLIKETDLNSSGIRLDDFIPKDSKIQDIESKWKPFEITEEIEEPNGYDFKELIIASKNTGGHFRFQSEKQWDKIISETSLGKIFTLDLTLLAKGLASIPLNERLELPENVFTEKELESIHADADENKKKYEEYLKKQNINVNANTENNLDELLNTTSNLKPNSNIIQKDNNDDILDYISNLDINKTSPPQKNTLKSNLNKNSSENEDFDEWLDSILD